MAGMRRAPPAKVRLDVNRGASSCSVDSQQPGAVRSFCHKCEKPEASNRRGGTPRAAPGTRAAAARMRHASRPKRAAPPPRVRDAFFSARRRFGAQPRGKNRRRCSASSGGRYPTTGRAGLMSRLMRLVVFLLALPAFAQAPGGPPPASPDPWPKSAELNGTKYTIYQPQLDSWNDYAYQAHAAVSVLAAGSKDPVFGVI